MTCHLCLPCRRRIKEKRETYWLYDKIWINLAIIPLAKQRIHMESNLYTNPPLNVAVVLSDL